MHISYSLVTMLMVVSFGKGQFVYNYEENPQYEDQPEAGESPLYKYNSPSDVEQYYPDSLRRISAPEPEPERPKANVVPQRSRYESRTSSVSRHDITEPEAVDYEADVEVKHSEPDYSQVATSYKRRSGRRRQARLRQRVEVTSPPRQYGPSVFENVGLGEAPSGIYVPEDSLLNLLRSDSPRRPNYVPNYNNIATEQPRRNDPPEVSPFYGQTQGQQHAADISESYYQSNTQPAYDSESEPRFYADPPQNEQFSSRPEPAYRPSTIQQIRPNELRKPKRPSQAIRQPMNQRKYRQQPVVEFRETPVQPESSRQSSRLSHDADPNRINLDERRRLSVQNFEEVPRKRHTTQNQITPAPSVRSRTTFKPARLAIAELPDDTDGDGIPGEAGVDYPTLHSIPTTSFSCSEQPHNGYYADLETSCQVMHLCQSGGNKDSFLCPNGTIFSQEKFSCQWWYKVNCRSAPRYYSINDRLYKVPQQNKREDE